jgi:heat shock protein HslJ
LNDAPVTATFGDESSLTGSSGCNNYSTTYETDGNSLTINPVIAATMMACPDPIMQQEQTYLAALGGATSYQISGEQLQLEDSNGNGLASFSAQKPVELAGSSWRATAYNNGNQAVVSLIIGTELTANFGTDGRLTGSAGCNDYSAAYQVQGETVSIGPAAVTQKFCSEPEGIMEQESQSLAALVTAAIYTIELNSMEMRSSDGALVANFEMIEPAPTATVSGTVTYLQRIALPPDAVVKVQLQDTSLADAPATVVGEQIIPTNGQQVPIPFEIIYDPAAIESNHTYTLSVRIEDASGQLLFINTSAYPVITNDNPVSEVEVVVEPVG